MLKGKRIIICDMDGTLIDSLGVWDSVDAALIEALGGAVSRADVGPQRECLLRALRAEKNPYLAYCRELGRLCGSALAAEEILALRDRIAERKLTCEVRYKPGAAEAARYLKGKGFVLGIATTTRRRNMEIYRLHNENLRAALPIDDWFSFVYTREDVAAIKPDPEVHEKVLAGLGARPEDCFIMEDSLSGVLAAKNARIDCAALYDSYSEGDWPEIVRTAPYHFPGWAAFLAAAQDELGE